MVSLPISSSVPAFRPQHPSGCLDFTYNKYINFLLFRQELKNILFFFLFLVYNMEGMSLMLE